MQNSSPGRKNFHAIVRRFGANDSGNMGMIFAFAALPLIAGVGAAIDYARISDYRAKLQAATDSAAFQTAMMQNATDAQMSAAAQGSVQAGVEGQYTIVPKVVLTKPATGTITVTSTAAVPTSLMKAIGIADTTISVKSTVAMGGAASGPVEIALALDNTGSMKGNMPGLISAANNLVNTVMPAGATNVKVSVVPYVAVVNPGAHRWSSSLIDQNGSSIWHAMHLKGAYMAMNTGCADPWGGGGGGGAGAGSSTSGDRTDATDYLKPLRTFAQQLFGITPARADVTANTIAPLTMTPQSGYSIPQGFTVDPPGGSGSGTPCAFLTTPNTVSHLDLFKRVGPNGVAWKGCVEARPTRKDILALGGAIAAEYDVSDAPPTNDPNSQFVPYFWPDESDTLDDSVMTTPGPFPQTNGQPSYHNNYLADGPLPAGWTYQYAEGYSDDQLRSRSILKYNKSTAPATIKETAPDSYGPNANCPDELQRLTTDKALVQSKISGMNYWLGGGTVISEGLMWAWRTLSPNMPFADGAAYGGATKKYIVLMTDGVNGLADNNAVVGDSPKSDYSAYGYLVDGRATNPVDPSNENATFDQMTSFLDARTLQACANAKAAGIKIYTVFFNNGLTAASATRAQTLLQTCASDAASSFLATDATSLNTAFGKVATSITAGTGGIRLVN